ncbi:magnesium chelatase subunit D [Aquisediminimonas profunda]|uniref:magnesium chelatase subunit D n=1 Tax=Aquisediminimonas profunda TaxID=1550733 RepID=UPI001C62BFA4|nr:magnesium chelatase subunit D [Aquisediminimonas profunda]
MTEAGTARWTEALLVARLFSQDPAGLGGVVVRACAGPVRDAWLAALQAMLPERCAIRKMPVGISDERLLGGLDLTATLAAGAPVVRPGLLAEADGGIILVPMAERLAEAAAHLCAVLDLGEVRLERDGLALKSPARVGVVLFDEGAGEAEQAPAALVERCAFQIDLGEISLHDIDGAAHPEIATDLPAEASLTDEQLAIICATAVAFGVDSLRAPILCARAAKLLARLNGRCVTQDEEIAAAARLILSPRATLIPADPAQQPEETPEQSPASSPEGDGGEETQKSGALADVVLEAVQAALPPALLEQMGNEKARTKASRGHGSGALRKSLMRGRPAGARRGDPGGHARLHLVETLRAAAPWQALRQADARRAGIIVHRSDFRVRRFAERAESTMIFAVDASGSAALERLAETKGAVELLLAEAYVRRTQVALIAFRGDRAEVVLAPTRSLARAKKCLAGLVGGGGTPLALGVETSQLLAEAARTQGRTPFVIFMTDGRANIARDRTPGRVQANEDALAAARRFRATGIAAAVLDISARPRDDALNFARAMGASYKLLPRAEAEKMRDIARALDPTA